MAVKQQLADLKKQIKRLQSENEKLKKLKSKELVGEVIARDTSKVDAYLVKELGGNFLIKKLKLPAKARRQY